MPPEQPILAELTRYVGFGSEDEELLRAVGPLIASSFPAAVDEFYQRIRETPNAHVVMREGPRQVDRLKGTLHRWLESVFEGPWDQAYVDKRARIGHVHVRIGLDQRYMFSAMNLLRARLHGAADTALPEAGWTAERTRRAHHAIDRICDLELALMLEAYRAAYIRQIRSSERLATLGQLAATIGHELRNPLAVIDTSIHLLRRRTEGQPGAERHLDRILEQTAVSNRIIADLLELARDRDPTRESVALDKLVEDAVASLPLPRGVAVDLDLDPQAPPAWVDASQLRQVIVNLVTNAIQATALAGGGRVRVEARERPEEALVLRVIDDGPGMTAETEARLFEPLFTTKSRGVGLGLALCKRIVDKHRGRIRGSSRSDRAGSVFEVVLPRALEADDANARLGGRR